MIMSIREIEEKGKDCSICAICGGECCKQSGCHYSPDDFDEISFDYLKKKIEEEGHISIDWYEGDPRLDLDPQDDRVSRALYLRVRNYKRNIPAGGISALFSMMLESMTNGGDLQQNTDEPCPIVDPSWGGKCVLHTENGCPLKYEERPQGARWLLAKTTSSGQCDAKYTKRECAEEWIPYQDILLKLESYFKDKDDIPVKLLNNK